QPALGRRWVMTIASVAPLAARRAEDRRALPRSYKDATRTGFFDAASQWAHPALEKIWVMTISSVAPLAARRAEDRRALPRSYKDATPTGFFDAASQSAYASLEKMRVVTMSSVAPLAARRAEDRRAPPKYEMYVLAALLLLALVSCGRNADGPAQGANDPALTTNGTVEVTAKVVEIPEGAIFKRDLYDYATILKYQV